MKQYIFNKVPSAEILDGMVLALRKDNNAAWIETAGAQVILFTSANWTNLNLSLGGLANCINHRPIA